MNLNVNVEVDPLAYAYPTFDNYAPPLTNQNSISVPYQNTNIAYQSYDAKNNEYIPTTGYNVCDSESSSQNVETDEGAVVVTTNDSNKLIENQSNIENTIDNHNDECGIGGTKRERRNGRKSNYLSEKIADSNFPFYGCAVCNISFKLLAELDQHIATHKDRITSYGLRLKNQIKRKKLRKEQKKMKKLSKAIKKEKELKVEIEIKPEDGYIGDTKAVDYKPDCENLSNNYENVSNQLLKCENGVAENQSKLQNESECKENKNTATANDKNQTDYNLEKMFKCFACQKQFTLSYYLKLHVRSHTDEKPYTCAECGQSFITASKLGRHNKRIHLAIRHQCRICYKYFSRFEYLTRHFDKKHPEDKLEGEPYDYNAILPYLKELEEQLQSNTEEQTKEGETKPKTETLWEDWPKEEPQISQITVSVGLTDVQYNGNDANTDSVLCKDGQKEFCYEVAVKKEEDSMNNAMENENDNGKEDSMKEESLSDEDYFPSNTWASTPKVEEVEEPPAAVRARRQRPEGPIKCKVCEKDISSLSYLRIHMRTHTGERPFKCYICNRGFITSSKMHRHVLTHSETWDESTDVKREVKSESDSDVPLKKIKHSKERKKQKAKHQKKGKPIAEEKEKEKKRQQKRPHACEYCQKRFLHLDTLQVHRKSHEGEELVLKCHYCLAKVDDDESLAAHEASHEGPKPYLCTLCGKSYKKRETMMYHRKQHAPGRRQQCDECAQSFACARRLRRHRAAHGGGGFVLRYECPVCAHMFNTKYHVGMHLATHQREGLIVEENRNEILAMVLQNARRIPKHPEAAGGATEQPLPDERSRMCNICGQVFQHFYYLEEHLKSHGSKIALEDEAEAEHKKHVCQVCNKGFKLHYYLKLHSFTHTKEKPYICQQCGKGFITRGKLKRHLETHTGLKKHQCHICYKFFTRPSYLRIHVRTIHGTQDYNFRLDKQFGVGSVPATGSGQTV